MRHRDIETLLRWVYRDELPKAAAGGGRLALGFRTGWGGVERYGELLAVVQEPDIRNAYGLVPDGPEGEPHADAIAAHKAVEALAGLVFEAPDGWDPLADMGGAGAFGPEGRAALARGLEQLTTLDAAGRRCLRRSPARLVIRQAILGGCPPWEGEAPVRRVVSAYGKPLWFRRVVQVSDGAFGPSRCEVEIDGMDHKRRLPHPDAYQRHYLDPDLEPLVQSRAEYELWHGAMAMLAEDLGVAPMDRPQRPWEGSAGARRILPSLLRGHGGDSCAMV